MNEIKNISLGYKNLFFRTGKIEYYNLACAVQKIIENSNILEQQAEVTLESSL